MATSKRTSAVKSRVKSVQESSIISASDASENPKLRSSPKTAEQCMAHAIKGLWHTLKVKCFNVWCVVGGPIWNDTEMSFVFLFILFTIALGTSGASKQLSKLVALML
ncbi:hypothetical protein Vretimale_17429 [Volvox reticuliferus]|uniref:Uncharacterized protein n=1 Tax=Volvox reticuliferus TaxID=1737510 RepID=A0A8J4GV19_9CHLO|nr:hypothetical protein Vretifemale_9411 [Volvox reticuliferus]GIM14479.1 hypothetical protein Vretimale_17429 [Volvox reticuliferus]